ncbi:NAD(P)H-binding protein [Mumia zhuanghuii]|uniref:NAD-dependent epimerase/dehydratase family protein n=1 Tax=Mumia zhuanghuii TaxID=2585211 RepID=A0A5C4LTB9_9ACTN|nr:NAD(P)H-binding protein [Mumia zhuanghuii]TNC22003.1 NAD-dependent epimerase/dehydratase family protein [Mumia zhuanghuii]
MDVFTLGITGRVGRRAADGLRSRGDKVSGLVRRPRDAASLAADGFRVHVGDLGAMTADELASLVEGVDVIVYTAGSNGGDREVTDSIDRDGVAKAAEAARLAGVRRFVLVSVFPEAWRERDLPDDEEYYFAAKKEAEVALTRTDLDWLILRPSLLTDGPATGRIAIGPAELHGQISTEDVAAVLTLILHEPSFSRQILELNEGDDPVEAAISRCVP